MQTIEESDQALVGQSLFMGAHTMQRRHIVKTLGVGGLAAGAAASTFPKPAISQNSQQWRLITTWPANFPGLGTGANLLAELIGKMSGGRLTIQVFGAGEIVPAFESMDAVSSGTVEMGHGAPYYWQGKIPATAFIATIPFGLTAQEQNAWFYHGGGQALADKVYAEMGTKFFPSGNTGVQMPGWFNKEINSLADFQGLRYRLPGLGGKVAAAAGATVVNLPGGELPQALASGAIDAVEWVGPYNDLAFGLYRSAQYYYHPGWHEPATVLDNFINLDAWNSLDDELKAIVEAANMAVNVSVRSEFIARNNDSLETLVDEHGVQVRKFSDEVLVGLGNLAGEVLNDEASADPLAREVMDSLLNFRKSAMNWAGMSEQAFMAARLLDYQYAEASAG
jgi:TRAP-type mannitol/chloroaromatic compound transport system substrate-binding protein